MCIKPIFPLIFLVLLVKLTLCSAESKHVKPVLPIEHWITKSGTPVYLVTKSQIPIVDISVIFNAGSAYDNDRPGIAQLTAELLDQGTINFNADQIANRFESVGARYSTAIDQDSVTIHLRSLSRPQFFNPAFTLFTELLSQTNFPQTAIQRIKKQTLIALQQEEQTPSILALNAFYRNLYGQHPYAFPVLGTPHGIAQITRANLINFYQHYYVAHNAVIAIVGSITKEKAINLAEQLTSTLPQGKKAIQLPVPLPQLTPKIDQIHYPSQQTTILLGQIGITLNDPDYFPLLVANQILGGGILTSQLFTEVRDKRGLCYGISSHFSTLQAGGPFIIGLQTRRNQASTALSVTQQTINNFVKNGPTEKELLGAKQALIGSFPLSIASNAAILASLEKIGFYQLPLHYLDNYRENIDKTTVEHVHKALKKHIHPKKMRVVMLGEN